MQMKYEETNSTSLWILLGRELGSSMVKVMGIFDSWELAYKNLSPLQSKHVWITKIPNKLNEKYKYGCG